MATVTNRLGKHESLALIRLADIPIVRHVKVKGTASPDDPSLSLYWQTRNTQSGKSYWTKGSKLYKVAANQLWKCPICGEHLFNGEPLHTHHIIAVKDGGTAAEVNLIHLHSPCHRHQHSKGTISQEQKARSLLDRITVTSSS